MADRLEYKARLKCPDPDCTDPPRCSELECGSTKVDVERKGDSVVIVCQDCGIVETIPRIGLLTAGEREWLKKNPST